MSSRACPEPFGGVFDELAVARVVLREPDLPSARLDGPDREVRMLVDHREALVSDRTRVINRLRWQLHEIDPEWDPSSRSLDRASAYDRIEQHLEAIEGLVERLAGRLLERLRLLTTEIDELTRELSDRVEALAPSLLAIPGCGPLAAAKIVGETAGISRFRSKDAYARRNGTAPLPVWSSNRTRHRFSRTGNRQLNTTPHRIALTQAHWHPAAKAMVARREAAGDGGLEALRTLKRRLSDVVYRALLERVSYLWAGEDHDRGE